MVVALYVSAYSDIFATKGPAILPPETRAEQSRKIEELGRRVEELATSDKPANTRYRDFERMNDELHKLGFFPDDRLMSALAFMTRAETQ